MMPAYCSMTVKKGGMPPGARAGFSMCVHKKRAVLFGGVVDMEAEGDVLMSLFLNELYGFQLDINRWYPLELRKEKSTKAKNKKIKDEEAINQMDVVTNDEDDNMECDIDEISSNMERNIRVNGSEVAGISSSKTHESTLEEVVKPCGRINASMVVGRDTLYIYEVLHTHMDI